MAPDDGTDWIQKLNDLASVPTSSLEQSVTKLVLLPIASFFIGLATAIEVGFSVVTSPMRAIANGVSEFMYSLLGGAADIVGAGSAASAAGIGVFGILGYIVGLAVVLGGAYLLGQYLTQDETSDLIPFTSTDIPFLGADEDSG